MSANTAFPITMGGPAACSTTGSLGPVFQAQYNGTVNGTNNNQISWTSTNSDQLHGYDAAGNLNNDGAHQYFYDGEARICEVLDTYAGVITAYLYDADGRRVAKGAATVWQNCDPLANGFQASNDYVLGPGGEQVTEVTVANGAPTGVAHTNAWAAGMLLATYDVNGLHFYLTDPLGSRRVQTDYAGVVEQTYQNLPFGDGEPCQPHPTEHLFTGKERDCESGNDYFGARYYASSMGRFMSPDWSATPEAIPYAKLDDPQSFNLYAYAGNNPLSSADEDGHCDWCQRILNCLTGNCGKTDAEVETAQAQEAAKDQDWLLQHGASKDQLDRLNNKQVIDFYNAAQQGQSSFDGIKINYQLPPVGAGLQYEPNDGKHGPVQRGNVSAEPTNAKETLDNSVPIKGTSTARVGVDPKTGEYVMFRETGAGTGVYHGYAVKSFNALPNEAKAALQAAKLVSQRGKIL